MARLILQTVLFVSLISALYGAPQNPTTPRQVAVPAIATLDEKPNEEHSTTDSSSEEAKIRPARTPDHDGTDHDHAHEHTDQGSSTTPKPRQSRDTEKEEKEDQDDAHVPSILTNLKDAVTTEKPRTARAAEKDEKHEDTQEHGHPATLTKDSQEHKNEEEQKRPARATEEEAKKSGVHDQPIPVPPTLNDEHHEAGAEEKKETPKHKREAASNEKHDEKDGDSKENESEESPLTYTKINSEHKDGVDYFALPNKESEYDRHTRQSNDEHYAHTKDIVTPEHPHFSLHSPHIHDDSNSDSTSSSSDESKSS